MTRFLIFTSAFLITLTLFLILTLRYKLKFNFDFKELFKSNYRKSWLEQADVNLEPMQFWLALASLSLTAFFITFLFTKVVLLSIVIGISIAFIPYSLISKRRLEISKKLMYCWPDTLRDINATISSGHTLTFALKIIAQQGSEPIAGHMRRFSTLEKSLGFRAALETVREEMNDATSDRVLEVLILANERGGKVVKEIIEDLINSTVEEISLAETIESESLEMKINSRAVVILPWCVLLLLILSGGVFRDYYQSRAGTFVIAIGVGLTLAGLYILNKLAQVEIEPRVFRTKVN